MTENLKRCPFCGGKEVRLFDNGVVWVVECRQCLAKICATFEKDAVDFWNYRPKEEQLGEQIREMKQKNAALKREILEAREDNADNMEYHVAERERLKKEIVNVEAENTRLREALQMISTEKDNHGQWLSVEQAAQIAKDTLEGCLI